MKRTQIVATLAFAFVFGASIPILAQASSTNAFATASETSGSSTPAASETPASSVTVSTAADFVQAVNDDAINYITLNADLDDVNIDIDRTGDLTIDLNRHTITNTGNNRILISRGNIRFTGTGSITGTSYNALTIRGSETNTGTNYVTVTIDENVTTTSNVFYGVAIVPYNSSARKFGSYGVTLNFNGQLSGAYGLYVNGTISDEANRPQINIGDKAVIAPQLESDSTPIYAAGTATWTIGRAKLSGKTGVAIRAGKLTFNGTTIAVDGAIHEPTTSSNGIDGTGVVFQIEHHNAYADQIVLNVNGGVYTSLQGDVFYEYGNLTASRAATQLADINITGGQFTAASDHEIFGGALGDGDANIEISGGTFTGSDVTAEEFGNFLKNGYKIGANGVVGAISSSAGGSHRPTSHVEAPEDPSDPKEPSDPTPSENGQNIVPDTGLNQNRGALTAASTILPLICGAFSMIVMASLQRVFARRKAARLAAAELEIDEQLAEIDDDEPEPIIERFVAEAIERDDPVVTPVDTFILPK